MVVLCREDGPVSPDHLNSKAAKVACEELSPGFPLFMKMFIEWKRIPEHFMHVEWVTYDISALFGTVPVFRGLPNFMFDQFISCQLLEEHKINAEIPVTEQPSSVGEELSPLDLTGCPLECPFEFTQFDGSDTHVDNVLNGEIQKIPLVICKAEHARFLLNVYTKTLYRSPTLPLPVLFLCDGLDLLQTILLASWKDCHTVKFIKGTRLPGVFTEKDVPALSTLKTEVMEMVPGKTVTEMQATAVYNIIEAKSSSFNALRLYCQWDDPLQLLQPPSINSLCKLDVQLSCSDEPSPLSFLYKELSALNRIIEGLESGEIAWCVENENEEETLDSRVQHLIQVAKEVRPSYTTQMETIEVAGSSDLQTCIEDILVTKRKHLDFTDHLWRTLIKSTSYAEVREILEYVTKAVSTGEISPMLPRNNKTALSCWINNHPRDNVLSLDGMEPLKHLGEIGLHKLQEDYCSLFLGLELASREMLSPFLKSWEEKEAAVKSLFLLHTAIELVLLCKVYLHLPQDILGEITRKVLKQCNYEESKKYEFSFQVPIFALQKKLTNLNPDEWQICLTSSSNALTGKISVHFARTLLPHLRRPYVSDSTEDHQYHATKYVFTEHSLSNCEW